MLPSEIALREFLWSLRHRVESLVRRGGVARELADEMRYHEEMLVQQGLAVGLTLREAKDRARRRFGSAAYFREESQDMWRATVIENLLLDVRFALRSLRRHAAANVVLVLLLALGIGATTAAVTLIDRVLLRALPVPHPEQLVILRRTGSDGRPTDVFPIRLFEALRSPVRGMSGIAAYDGTRLNVRAGTDTKSVEGRLMSGNVYTLLGVRALVGRAFGDSDDVAGHPAVAVLSYRYWLREFSGDATVVGRTLAVNGLPVSIVGVMPPEFMGISAGQTPEDIWLPMAMHPIMGLKDHDQVSVLGRLATGVDRRVAEGELTALYRGALAAGLADAPGATADSRLSADRLANARVDLTPAPQGTAELANGMAVPLRLALAIGCMLLLVICANVAGLLVVRGTTRTREIAIRLAMGVSRARLAQQLLVESLVLSALGGVFGILAAWWGTHLIIQLFAYDAATVAVELAPDWRMLVFVATACITVALLLGAIPARLALGLDLHTALRASAGRSVSAGQRAARLGRILVTAQLALSLVLVVDGALLADSARRIASVEPGFDRDHVLVFWAYPVALGYAGAREQALYRELSDRLAAIPGVRATSFARRSLGWGVDCAEVSLARERSATPVYTSVNAVGPRFFETTRIPLLQGREFSWSDQAAGPAVAIIGQTFARRAFGGESAIGRRLRYVGGPTDGVEVVGVAADVRVYALDGGRGVVTGCDVFIPVSQAAPRDLGQMTFVARSDDDPAQVAPLVRRAVAAVEPNLAVLHLQTTGEMVRGYFQGRTSVSRFAVAFSLVALLIAAIGLYGVLAYSVAGRTREIGIRTALGATPAESMRLVLSDTARLVAVGLAFGVVGALISARLLGSMMLGLGAMRPAPLAIAAGAFTAVAFAAACIPARRAARIDPLVALRID